MIPTLVAVRMAPQKSAARRSRPAATAIKAPADERQDDAAAGGVQRDETDRTKALRLVSSPAVARIARAPRSERAVIVGPS